MQLHRLVFLDVELGGVHREVLHVHVAFLAVLALRSEQLKTSPPAFVCDLEHHVRTVPKESARTD